MGAIISALASWFFGPIVQRILWAGGSLWFALAIIPLLTAKLFALVGDPFSLITPEMWWAIDLFGVDIWMQFMFGAIVIKFVLRRMPK